MNNLPLIVLIGDSIRMGYQDHVASELAGRAEVWVPEENGGDSRNVLAHLDQWVSRASRIWYTSIVGCTI